MPQHIITRLAAIFTIFIFLGNDVMASVVAFRNLNGPIDQYEAIHPNLERNRPQASTSSLPASENILPTEGLELPETFSNRAKNTLAFIGSHPSDPMGSPTDDVFQVDLKEQWVNYQFGYLQYEVKGLANPEALPKAINGHEVYMSEDLQAGSEWQRVTVMVDYSDLRPGTNSIRFAMPNNTDLAVEVKNVQIHLSAKPKAVNKGLKMKRRSADLADFKLLVSNEKAISFKNNDVEMAGIPKGIRNLTRNSWGFGLRNNGDEAVKIAIGADASKLNKPNDLKDANIFYYNTLDNTWKKVPTEKVDMANLVLEATVPPNTDYFAGLIKSPDMPEASAFLPTGISDIEAASPAAGMNLISPPSQSRTGEASVSYPLQIPGGRQGLAPSLAINYSSDAGSSWLGYGWNLSVPSIGIDARWGVPTFPATVQEEVYSLNGSPLTQEGGTKGNRAKVVNGAPVLSPRLTSQNTVTFFERTMNGYKKIERIGLDPTNYRWIETTSSNTKLYYGTLDGSAVDTYSTLADANGNIVKWCLTKMEDQWGNHIKYYYHKGKFTVAGNSSLNPMKDGGTYHVLDRIEYTGHNQDPGQYSVVFESTPNRPDANVSMKMGFKVLDDHQLNKVVVKYGTSLIKDYRMYYSEGDFKKTRLDSIAEYRKGKHFYAHDFEYYSGSLTFGQTQTFPIDNLGTDIADEISPDLDFLVNPILNILNASPIKTSSTWGWSSGGSLGLGIAPIGDYASGKRFTLSGQLGYSENNSKDKRSLQDMNADGLLDMVVDKKGGRGFYPLQKTDNGLEYGSFVDIHNNDQPLFKSKSVTTNYGFDFSLLDKIYYFGKNWSKGTSTVEHFTTDYNADGFPDLVVVDADGKSKVLFGSLNSLNELQYNPTSANSANPIYKNQPLDPVNTDDDELKDLETVKIWTAPFTGTVNISGMAEHVGTTNGETRIAVQIGNAFMVHGFRAVDANTSISTNYNGQFVSKGEIILFRVKSGVDGQQDLLTWNPRIDYTNINYLDGNGINYTDSKYEDAFIPSGAEYITIEGDQNIKVDLNRSLTGTLNDDLVYEMTVEEFDPNQDLLTTIKYHNVVDANSTNLTNENFTDGNATINFGLGTFQSLPNTNPNNSYRIHFSLFSTSNVDWRNVKFRPVVEVSMIGTCDLGATMFPTVEYGTYNRVEHMSDWFSIEGAEIDEEFAYRVWPSFTHSSAQVQAIFEGASGSNTSVGYMTVKDGNETLSKLRLTFHQSNGTISYDKCDAFGSSINSVNSSSSAAAYSLSTANVNSELIVEFFVDGYTFSEKTSEFISSRLNRIAFQDNSNGPWQDLVTTSEDYNLFYKDPAYVGDKILHWGQFAWSFPSTTPESERISIEDLHPDIETLASDSENQFDSENTPDNGFFEENEVLLNPMNHKFIVMKALRGEKDIMLRTYEKSSFTALQTSNLLSSAVSNEAENLDRYACLGSHIGIYASSGMSSPGKFGESEIVVPIGSNQIPDDLYMAFATTLVTKSKSSSKTSGNILTCTSSDVFNINKYYSKSLVQFQDYNGDGYPDRLIDDGTDVNANFTSPLGGHKASTFFTSYDLSKNATTSSISASPGSFVDKDARFEKMPTPTASYGTSKDFIQHTDINGDGLPDRIEAAANSGISAALSNGSGTEASAIVTGHSEGTSATSNSSFSLNINPNLKKLNKKIEKTGASFGMGIGVNHVASHTNTTFMDLNGDGLSDCISLTGQSAEIFINTGTSFYRHSTVSLEKELNHANGFGFSGSVAGTYAFPAFSIPILGIDLKVSVNANGGASFSQNEVQSSFQDVNGDGYVDYITEDNGLKVQYGQIGKSNLLHKVNNPLKGSFEINYERIGNQTGFHEAKIKTHLNGTNKVLWDMPNSKWVMSSLNVVDGLDMIFGTNDIDGEDEFKAYFYYEGGIKSRRERSFLGFTRTEKRQMPFANPNNRNGTQLSSFDLVLIDDKYSNVYYVSEVNQYMEPTSNNFLYRKRSEYTNSILTENFTYLNIKSGQYANGVSTFTTETHPISMNIYSYDFRNVCTDPNSTYFNELYPKSQAESTINWLAIEETESIFPSMTTLQKVQYPEVFDPVNRPRYASQKFLLTYDDRWNVIQYEDEGKLISRVPGATAVETYTRDWYDYKTQSQPFSSLTLSTELSDDNFNAYYVSCTDPDPAYSTAIVYIAQKADACFGFANQNYPDDNFMVITEHKKQMTETVQILTPSFNDVYVDKLIAVMEYFEPSVANGKLGVLKTHKIYENSIDPVSLKRHSEVATLFQGKAPSSIWNILSSTEKAITDIAYHNNGNVKQIMGPENATGQRMTVDYTYDSSVNQFVTAVSNSYGESSCSFYDYGTGSLLKSVDINGHAMRYIYDDMFRVSEIWAPRQLYDAESSPTLSFEYYPKGINKGSTDPYQQVPVAITNHNFDATKAGDPFATPRSNCTQLLDLSQRDPIANPMRTATFVDGLSRVVQVKKDVAIDNGTNQNVSTVMVSGWEILDQWAKPVSASNTLLDPSSVSLLGRLLPHSAFTMSTVVSDYLGRPLVEIAPVGKAFPSTGYSKKQVDYTYGWTTFRGVDFISTEMEISVKDVANSTKSLSKTLTNPRGRQRYSQQIDGTTKLTTETVYNPLGEIINTIDPLGLSTSYQYDLFGRTIQENHPDRGQTSWTYDLSGNLSELNNEGTGTDHIAFDYHYNRLTDKTMPISADLYNVQYTYGAAGDGKNGAGRVTSVIQGTNFKTENYKYDELGSQIFEQKVINVPQTGTQTWTTEFNFDSWGRILEMLYPDGEEVYYDYTSTGELEKIHNSPTSPLDTVDRTTIENITYDGFGNIVYMKYGNGADIRYEYDPETRAIDEVHHWTKGVSGLPLLETYEQVFSYDGIGRIDALDQTKIITSPNTTGTVVSYDYDYAYDKYNRLISTTGAIDGDAFNMSLTYNDAGGILTKDQSLAGGNSYNLVYNYQIADKHKINTVDGHKYTYNAAGSIESIAPTGTPTIPSEKFIWNEEEWLMAVENNNGYHHYIYDQNGERIMKSTLTTSQTAIDGEGNTNTTLLDPYAVYVNPYFIVTRYSANQDVSKHYYMGSLRVATERIVWGIGQGIQESEGGSGANIGFQESEEQSDSENAVANNLNDVGENASQSNPVTESFAKILTKLGLEENKDFDRTSMDETIDIEEYFDLSVYGGIAETGEDPGEGDQFFTRQRYWYHPNYLGNVDMITNENGQIHQYFVYSPFGENMYQYNRNSEFDSRYRFNGKELDPETGNQYYGARYYDPKISVWLSVDPHAHKYKNVTPYNFVENNPVFLVDPDGNGPWAPNGDGTYTAEAGDGAETLARDANISKTEAYNLMAQQGHGTYTDPDDGIVKSAVDEGDVVQVSSSNASCESTCGNSSNAPANGTNNSTQGGDSKNSSNVPLAAIAALSSAGDNILNGSSMRFLKGGKFSPKIYTSGWGGGSRGNIKTTKTGGVANVLKAVNFAAGAYNANNIEDAFDSGQINQIQRGADHASNAYSTFGGLPGAAWGLGWEIGRGITTLPGYQGWKQNTWLPFRESTLGY